MPSEEVPYANEKVVEYGVADKKDKITGEVVSTPFVITETSPPFDPNNKTRTKYWGADIPTPFINQVKELEEEAKDKQEFEEWKKTHKPLLAKKAKKGDSELNL